MLVMLTTRMWYLVQEIHMYSKLLVIRLFALTLARGVLF